MEIPRTQWAVQLTGPDKLVLNTSKPVPAPGRYQILAKVEAVGLCFSDLKLLHQFSGHVRKGPVVAGLEEDALRENPGYVPGDAPTVPGHEVVCRVVAVGEGVSGHKVGERIIPQPDWRSIRTAGSNAALGYNFEGALQEYILLDERIILDNDGRDRYVFSVADGPSAASLALVEPWGCVENSYATSERNRVKPGGRLLVVAMPLADVVGLDGCLSPDGPPAGVTMLVFEDEQRSAVRALGLPVTEADSVLDLPDEGFDDIVFFGSDRGVIEILNDKLAKGGVINVVLGGRSIGEPVNIGVGRIHYGPTRWVGTTGSDASASYGAIPRTGELRPGDRALIVGAGGPMGQMHVIRALSSALPGLKVTASDTDDGRLAALEAKARPIAEASGVAFETVRADLLPVGATFTYFAIMAPVAPLVADAIARSERGAVINVFAGIPAPVKHPIDLDAVIGKQVFVYGTSGSEAADMRAVLDKVLAGRLSTEASVDAVCGMAGAINALAAVENRSLAGKIVVYPELHDLPLSPLSKLAESHPTVAALLHGGCWSADAEAELLRVERRSK
jgi:threonine dehydrogenase-like Zn-dependent dehydrogenase